MIRYGANLRGTRAYWLTRHELMEMIRKKGSPHVFLTLSPADLQWPDLHRQGRRWVHQFVMSCRTSK
jgi:hypothetical protein